MSKNETQKPREMRLDDPARLLTDAEAERIIDRVVTFCKKQGELRVSVLSEWRGGQRWARNRAFMSSDWRGVRVEIFRKKWKYGFSMVTSNQVDDASLRAACAYVEDDMAKMDRAGFDNNMDLELTHTTWEEKGIPIWSEATYNHTVAEKARVVVDITELAESNGMLSAGLIETVGAHKLNYLRDAWGREERETGHVTMAQCSSTVRHPKGVGSGWAGASSFDLKRLDLAKLGKTAFDKCMRSMNPARIEPGRYQTILEPQAVASFASALVNVLDRAQQEQGGPLYLSYDSSIERHRSKLGLRIIDRRISISHDPVDPITGTPPVQGMRKIDYVKDGVLTAMETRYDNYALPEQDRRDFNMTRASFVMRGSETTTVDEMISSMKRGLLLTRVSDLEPVQPSSLLYTGFTRDGLWLIENGKITKAVRNFRLTESPLFIFNNVESIGEPESVMSPSTYRFILYGSLQSAVPSIVVPTMKINDFSFTSTIDAI